ncbi:MAG: hypothetical protein JWM99_1923 [Verrucomicrobiales bacterium]|nr:hypothetical protein [Verrucomicrobiales bacterium]
MGAKWFFDADYLQACNCDYGCPCEFSAPPTSGFCEGVGAWKISQGKFNQIPLDDLAIGFAARWPKAIHEGNGTLCLFFDERANPQQRDALIQIASGAVGGLPFEILATTFSTVHEPQYVPFEFHLAGINSRARVGEAITIALESIKNPVTGDPEQVRIEHGTGFIFKNADAVSARECTVSAGPLAFSWPNKAGFVTRVRYGN